MGPNRFPVKQGLPQLGFAYMYVMVDSYIQYQGFHCTLHYAVIPPKEVGGCSPLYRGPIFFDVVIGMH